MARFKLTASIEGHLEPTRFTVEADSEDDAAAQVAIAARRRVRRISGGFPQGTPAEITDRFEAELPAPIVE